MNTTARLALSSLALATAACAAIAITFDDAAAQATPAAGAAPTAAPVSAEQASPAVDAPHHGLAHFKQHCAACHSFGAKLLGPDLRGVGKRVPGKDWVKTFVRDPNSQLGDGYGKQMVDKFKAEGGTPIMTPFPSGMFDKDAKRDAEILDAIIEFIFADGPGLAAKIAKGQENVERGRKLFTGEHRLTNGGPPCISCHTTWDMQGLGGGSFADSIAPAKADLSSAHTRFGDAGLSAALTNPSFRIMKDAYAVKTMTSEEVNDLVAYLAWTAGSPEKKAGHSPFLLWGLLGTAGMLIAFNIAWRGRFRNVRRTLVDESPRPGGREHQP